MRILKGTRVKFKTMEKIKQQYEDGGKIYVSCHWAPGLEAFMGEWATVSNDIEPSARVFRINKTDRYSFSSDLVEEYTNFVTVGCRYGISSVDVEDTEAPNFNVKVHISQIDSIKIGSTVVVQDDKGIRLMTVTSLDETPTDSTTEATVIQVVDMKTFNENMKDT